MLSGSLIISSEINIHRERICQIIFTKAETVHFVKPSYSPRIIIQSKIVNILSPKWNISIINEKFSSVPGKEMVAKIGFIHSAKNLLFNIQRIVTKLSVSIKVQLFWNFLVSHMSKGNDWIRFLLFLRLKNMGGNADIVLKHISA